MTYTLVPSIKGQITLPPAIRTKYNIGKNTPIIIEDKGDGVMNIKVMQLMDYGAVQYSENDTEVRLSFRKGIDPQVIINKLNKNG